MALGILALTAGIAATGCGGSDAEAEGPIDITEFRANVKERFGTPPNEAPWYRHITAIDWANGPGDGQFQIIEITTDLDDRGTRRVPCGLLWGLAFGQADKPNTFGVSVVSSDGKGGWGCA
jgi:hypothetical protein